LKRRCGSTAGRRYHLGLKADARLADSIAHSITTRTTCIGSTGPSARPKRQFVAHHVESQAFVGPQGDRACPSCSGRRTQGACELAPPRPSAALGPPVLRDAPTPRAGRATPPPGDVAISYRRPASVQGSATQPIKLFGVQRRFATHFNRHDAPRELSRPQPMPLLLFARGFPDELVQVLDPGLTPLAGAIG